MKSVSIIIVVFMLAISQNLNAQSFDFRNTKWGMDTIQVKKSETARFIYSNSNSLNYSGKLSNLDTKIIYDFTSSNQLYQTFYLITLNSKNPSIFVDNFLRLQELLTEKYYQPFSRSAFTINGRNITQDEWASNLISDNLNLETRWKTARTDIILSLYTPNDELTLEIRYISHEFNKKASDEIKINLLKDL